MIFDPHAGKDDDLGRDVLRFAVACRLRARKRQDLGHGLLPYSAGFAAIWPH